MKFELRVYDMTADQSAAAMAALSSISIGATTMTLNGATTGTATAATLLNAHAPTNDDDNGPANANAPAVDAQGLPWDDRIHSKNKGMNADNTWRKKRNVAAELVTSVEAELRAKSANSPGMNNPAGQMQPQPQMQQPAPQMMPQPQFTPPMQQPAPQMMPQPQFTPPMPDQQQTMMQPQPQMQQQPVMQQQPMDFQAFMQHLAGQMSKRDTAGAPLITTDYLANVAQRLSQQFGRQFGAITDIAGDPNAIAFAAQLIALDGRWN